jgi:hypothetical protein
MPDFHGHSYTRNVTASTTLDEATGFVVDLGVLDRVPRAPGAAATVTEVTVAEDDT